MSFSVVGPMALQSQRLVGKSDGDKVYFPHGAGGWGGGEAGPAQRDPTYRNLKASLLPEPQSDQAISCLAGTPTFLR